MMVAWKLDHIWCPCTCRYSERNA